MATTQELAWAAGLYEGAGSASSDPNGDARLQLAMSDPEPVQRFLFVVGRGKIYGPYEGWKGDGYTRRQRWLWVAQRDDALVVAETLYAWLSTRRREQIDVVATEHRRTKNVKTPARVQLLT